MTRASLEERLNVVERQLAELQAQVQKLERPKDWRNVVGMFTGDDFMKQVDEAGRKIREKDRERARKAARNKTKAKK